MVWVGRRHVVAQHLDQRRAIYQVLVGTNTTDSVGETTKAAEAMGARLKSAGFPAADGQVLSSAPLKGNLVARYRGNGAGESRCSCAPTGLTAATNASASATYAGRDFLHGPVKALAATPPVRR